MALPPCVVTATPAACVMSPVDCSSRSPAVVSAAFSASWPPRICAEPATVSAFASVKAAVLPALPSVKLLQPLPKFQVLSNCSGLVSPDRSWVKLLPMGRSVKLPVPCRLMAPAPAASLNCMTEFASISRSPLKGLLPSPPMRSCPATAAGWKRSAFSREPASWLLLPRSVMSPVCETTCSWLLVVSLCRCRPEVPVVVLSR